MDYRNPAACLELLGRLRQTNVDETHAELTRIVTTLRTYPPAPNQHLEVLETARPLIVDAQTELSRRYAAHPLPPQSRENAIMESVVTLWRELARSYTRIILADTVNGSLAENMPLLFQRQLYSLGQVILEYFRARRALPAGAWTDLHGAFAAAERHEVARSRVGDPLNEVWRAQSSTECFVSILLTDLANPFGRTQRELNWIIRWAQRFAPYCALKRRSEGGNEVPLRYGVDLGADHGVRPIGVLKTSDSLRHFDGTRLASHIQAVVSQLKQGVSPASLGLGEDCPALAGGRLLVLLYRPWGLASAGRKFSRRGARGSLELIADWNAIAFHIEGRRFTPPSSRTISNVTTDMNVLTFGERAPEVPMSVQKIREEAGRLGLAGTNWEVLDQSVGGFRLRCRPTGLRLDHHQLVGIRPPDGEAVLLARISWLMYREDGTLEAGVSVLPGVPSVAAARTLNTRSSAHDPYQACFLLPAVPALKADASVVLPGGWYQPERIIELHGDRATQVRLAAMMSDGSNFDQVVVKPLRQTPN
ncbi:MAG: hypothetical protein KDH17_01220 [Rhodocyclaceae bacterium]|nr:hypothetical protein [Rhodocyclaceae bacterium]